MILAGYLLAVIMGMTLGLIGAGGSILTVPILVYLFGVPPIVATGYSLLVVGSAALSGAIIYQRKNLVNLRAVVIFAIPAMLTVLATRSLIVPSLPDYFYDIPKNVAVMLMFGVLMIIAASFMLRPPKVRQTTDNKKFKMTKLVAGSAGVGFLTGMVGAGGGFIIIPTLIMLFGLHMKEAVGTSLAIIAVNSLIGFNGDIAAGIKLDLPLLLTFIGLTLLGMALGTALSRHIDGGRLKKIFAIFTMLVGFAVMADEVLFLMGEIK